MWTPEEDKSGFHAVALLSTALILGGFALELSRTKSVIGWTTRVSFEAAFVTQGRRYSGGLVITEEDIDIVTRTIIGEDRNGSAAAKIAVAWVIINRAQKNKRWYGGNKLTEVSLYKTTRTNKEGKELTTWQFEPWMHRSVQLMSISTESVLYTETRALVVGCINGTFGDPTDGATHFLEPDIVRSRTGGTLPKWAQGEGKRIGAHVFFKHD